MAVKLTKKEKGFLCNNPIEKKEVGRYTPSPNEGNLILINALYKKGCINFETYQKIVKIYGGKKA